MKWAWWIGSCFVLALGALAWWLGSSEPHAAQRRGDPVQGAPDNQVAQQPASRTAPAHTDDQHRDQGPAARTPTPGQALHEVEALVDQGKIGAARDLAEQYLTRMPAGPEAARIQSLTGVHPHRTAHE